MLFFALYGGIFTAFNIENRIFDYSAKIEGNSYSYAYLRGILNIIANTPQAPINIG